MKAFPIKPLLLAVAATAMLGIGVNAAPQKSATVSMDGEIVNRACLSHQNKANGQIVACTDRAGAYGKYVFYDPATNKAYRIKDQARAAEFAGQEVTVAGYRHTASHKLHITNIMPTPTIAG